MFSMHFSDIPIMAKLGFLVIVAGLLPLSIVAAWSVWGMVERVNFLAAQTNKDVAREIRNEVERHALLLNAYARRLERAGPNDADIAALLQHWQEVPETFSSLEMIDRTQVEARMAAPVREAFRDRPVGFYHGPAHGSAHAAALNQSRPDLILSEVNAAILSAERPSSEFVTMFCAVLDQQEGRLFYCSAGHPPGILVRQGRSESLELGSLPLAVEADAGYELCEVRLDPGDAVVMFTDGVTEAMNAERQEFGQQRLETLVGGFDGTGAEELAEEVLRHVREFTGPVPQSDDLTLVVVSCNE